MKKNIQTFVALVAVFGLAISAQAVPKLAVHPGSEFRFGFAPQNSNLTTIYWLVNTGDDTMHISKVQPSCGCTKAPTDKNVVAPGDSAKVEISFNSKSFMGLTSKRTSVSTDAANPDTNLVFSTEVVRRPDSTWPMTISPYKLDLTQVGEKVRDKISVWLRNVSPDAITVQPVVVPKDLFMANFTTSIKANDSVKVELKLTPEAVKKEFASSITLEVTGKESYRYTLPVSRKFREPTTTAAVSPSTGSGK